MPIAVAIATCSTWATTPPARHRQRRHLMLFKRKPEKQVTKPTTTAETTAAS